MNRPTRIVLALTATLGLATAGCAAPSGSGAASSSSSASTPSVTAPLHVVGIGDSYMSTQDSRGQSFMDVYGERLTAVLGRPAEVINLASDNATTDSVRQALTQDSETRSKVSAADVIVISVGGNDSDPYGVYPKGTCATTASADSCMSAYAPRFARNYEAILSAVTALRQGKPTLIRATSTDNPFVGWSQAPSPTFGRDFYAQVAGSQTAVICALASKHGAKCVDYLHVFGGADGLHDPAAFLAADHAHPGDKGVQTIADLLLTSGTSELS